MIFSSTIIIYWKFIDKTEFFLFLITIGTWLSRFLFFSIWNMRMYTLHWDDIRWNFLFNLSLHLFLKWIRISSFCSFLMEHTRENKIVLYNEVLFKEHNNNEIKFLFSALEKNLKWKLKWQKKVSCKGKGPVCID